MIIVTIKELHFVGDIYCLFSNDPSLVVYLWSLTWPAASIGIFTPFLSVTDFVSGGRGLGESSLQPASGFNMFQPPNRCHGASHGGQPSQVVVEIKHCGHVLFNMLKLQNTKQRKHRNQPDRCSIGLAVTQLQGPVNRNARGSPCR